MRACSWVPPCWSLGASRRPRVHFGQSNSVRGTGGWQAGCPLTGYGWDAPRMQGSGQWHCHNSWGTGNTRKSGNRDPLLGDRPWLETALDRVWDTVAVTREGSHSATRPGWLQRIPSLCCVPCTVRCHGLNPHPPGTGLLRPAAAVLPACAIHRAALPRRGAAWSRLSLITPACHRRVFLGTAAAGIPNGRSLHADAGEQSWASSRAGCRHRELRDRGVGTR